MEAEPLGVTVVLRQYPAEIIYTCTCTATDMNSWYSTFEMGGHSAPVCTYSTKEAVPDTHTHVLEMLVLIKLQPIVLIQYWSGLNVGMVSLKIFLHILLIFELRHCLLNVNFGLRQYRTPADNNP